MLRINRLKMDDIPLLLPLVKEYWKFEGIGGFKTRSVVRQLERLLTDSRLGFGLIAMEGDIAIGYLLAVYVFSLEHLGVTAEIDEFFVVSEYRSRGAGRKLLKKSENISAGFGCTNISLQIYRHNNAARSFYLRHEYLERSGFEILEKSLKLSH